VEDAAAELDDGGGVEGDVAGLELEAWAADELRSVNGQIEYLLREATRKRRGTREKGLADERPPAGEAGG
jgi:hypothetical protein